MLKTTVLLLLKIYKLVISPFFESVLGHGCRFSPTCSDYMYVNIHKLGLKKGVLKGLKRLASCHSFPSFGLSATNNS